MNINVWIMWDSEKDFINWKENDTSKHDTIATVDNGKYRLEYEYCEGVVYVYEEELDTDTNCYKTVDEYVDSSILRYETLEDVLTWLFTQLI